MTDHADLIQRAKDAATKATVFDLQISDRERLTTLVQSIYEIAREADALSLPPRSVAGDEVPAGMVLVPVEPTEAMEDAAMHATTACEEDFLDEDARQEFRIGYREAIAAAPKEGA